MSAMLKQLGLCALVLSLIASCSTARKSVATSANSQDGVNIETAEVQDVSYDAVEQDAEFPGGVDALLKHIQEHIRYPTAAKKKNIQGVVMLRFLVERDGSIGEIQVTRSLSPACDKQAVRVIRKLPKFKPAIYKGKPVRKWFNIPIHFRLQ